MRKVVHVIELEEGNFKFGNQQILYIKEGERVRFISGSRKNATLRPLLLTDRKIKSKLYKNIGSEITANGIITKADMTSRYKVIYGQLDREGYWIADKSFKFIGPISLQMVFCREDPESYFVEYFGRQEKIIVEPDNVDLNILNIMSVLPRCIGAIDKWPDFFNYQTSLGYNAFHFPPLQELGSSNSYYSIADQHQLNPTVFPLEPKQRYEALDSFIKDFNHKRVIFFVDIVLNHTSTNSKWLLDDPDAAYNVENTPQLASAFLVDQTIFKWGNKITQGVLQGYPKTTIDSDQDLHFLQKSLLQQIRNLNISDYFQINPNIIDQLLKLLPPSTPSTNIFSQDPALQIQRFINENILHLGVSRLGVKVGNLEKWSSSGILYEKNDILLALKKVNERWRGTVEGWMEGVPGNVIKELKHQYLAQGKQPRKGVRVAKTAFSQIKTGYYVLNNGWVMNCNPLENFATSMNFHYLRRNVSIWGDLAKLRFGYKKEDSPKLWNRFKEYVKIMAKHFNGFRLDNCHGTPLAVGEYMVRQARKVNPNILIFAELFTNSKEEDAIFIKRLGIHGIVKQMVYCDTAEKFVDSYYRHSGLSSRPLGSLDNRFQKGQEQRIFVNARMPTYVNYDLSHDNLTYYQTGRWQKQLPLTILLSFLGCCLGTNKGYDQYYKSRLHVTQQRELYQQDQHTQPHHYKVDHLRSILTFTNTSPSHTISVKGSWNSWTQPLKLTFVENHYQGELTLPPGDYEYKYIVDDVWCTDKKKQIVGRDGNHMISLTAESRRRIEYNNLEGVRRIVSILRDKYEGFREIYMTHQSNMVEITKESVTKDRYIYIIGNMSNRSECGIFRLPGEIVCCLIWTQGSDMRITESYCLREYFDILVDHNTKNMNLRSGFLPVGFCCVIECRIAEEKFDAIQNLKCLVTKSVEIPDLSANDVNDLIFCCSRENEVKTGAPTYIVPGSGALIYGGFGGVYRNIREAMRHNKLHLPLFENLRKGDWIFEYFVDRFVKNPKLNKIVDHMDLIFSLLKVIPRHEIPYFFCKYVNTLVADVRNSLGTGVLPIKRSQFSKNLIMSSCQFFTQMPCQLPQFKLAMAAGLPHFSTSWARCWGRDTFISNQLLLLFPKLLRQHILMFASTLRHSILPNLLDSGQNPRYNSRDATWWFVRSVKDYANHTGDYDIFKEQISMVFLDEQKLEHEKLKRQGGKVVRKLEEIIQEIFQATVEGIYFREWDAGIQIDPYMKNQGFNVSLKADISTGFILGGNIHNCLTWMDKMGSSQKAETKGCPATSRNGAPIELMGLLKHNLDAYEKLHKEGKYSYNTVKLTENTFTFADWARYIQENFEKWFWIPEDLNAKKHHSIENEYVKIKGMYKDVVKSHNASQQYRLRPNGLITLALAPQLLVPEHARRYLSLVGTRLIHDASLGVGTLDRVHQSLYCEYYDNDDDTDNYITAQGFSYHNGPEWLWLYGFYVKALLNFSQDKVSRSSAMALLQNHIKHIKNDPWMSLPEITNVNGEYNKFGCPAQAWSISSALLALTAIDKLRDE